MSNCILRCIDNRFKKLKQYVKYMVVNKLLSITFKLIYMIYSITYRFTLISEWFKIESIKKIKNEGKIFINGIYFIYKMTDDEFKICLIDLKEVPFS